MYGVELDELDSVFNFLPDSEGPAEPGEAGNDSSESDAGALPYHPLNRSLVDDHSDQCTWKWHPTAGKIFRQEPNTYKRWKGLFEERNTVSDGSYSPFTSRLEWEMAQWVVNEKISQKAFNRLLDIPNVSAKSITSRRSRVTHSKLDSGKRMARANIYQRSVNAKASR